MTGLGMGVPPQPLPDQDTMGFWDATARGELALCRCQECHSWQHPPVERCRRCAGPTQFEAVRSDGTVFSFIVANRASVPGFADLVPYAVALVELDEHPGVRLVSRLIGIDPADVRIGLRVAVEIEDLPGGGYGLPVWRPAPTQ
jgi:uncharacterized OB-fold protein